MCSMTVKYFSAWSKWADHKLDMMRCLQHFVRTVNIIQGVWLVAGNSLSHMCPTLACLNTLTCAAFGSFPSGAGLQSPYCNHTSHGMQYSILLIAGPLICNRDRKSQNVPCALRQKFLIPLSTVHIYMSKHCYASISVGISFVCKADEKKNTTTLINHVRIK